MMEPYNTVRFVLRLAAIATFFIGLLTILIPQLVISWIEGFDGNNFHFVRFIGTALIGFSITNWLYSNFHDMSAVLPAIYGNLVSLTIAIFIDGIGIAFGKLAPAAWLVLGLHIAFASAFVYCIVLINSPNRKK